MQIRKEFAPQWKGVKMLVHTITKMRKHTAIFAMFALVVLAQSLAFEDADQSLYDIGCTTDVECEAMPPLDPPCDDECGPDTDHDMTL